MAAKKTIKSKVDKKSTENIKLKSKISKHKNTKLKNQADIMCLTQAQIRKAKTFLNQKERLTPYKKIEAKRRASKCKLPIYELQQNEKHVHNPLNSMSYINILRHMRTCILNHDWNNLTKLLIVFFDAKKLNSMKLRNAFINLLNNPDAIRNNFLDEFLQMFVCCHTEDDKIQFMNKLLNLEVIELKEKKMNMNVLIDEMLSN